MREPKVFLFDEPLSNLDASLRVQMRIEIKRLHERLKTTMIYVTHDQVEAMTLADKIVVLDQGQVAQVGAPLSLYHYPANQFVAGFIGSPAMNFVAATLVSADSQAACIEFADGLQMQVPVSAEYLEVGAKVCLGIRPEHTLFGTGDVLMDTELLACEHLGDTTLLHLLGPDQELLTLRTPNTLSTGGNKNIQIGWNSTDCHLFDEQGTACQRLTKGLDKVQ